MRITASQRLISALLFMNIDIQKARSQNSFYYLLSRSEKSIA
jgi:hypothetical protein